MNDSQTNSHRQPSRICGSDLFGRVEISLPQRIAQQFAANGPTGQLTTVTGQPLAAGSCINPCVMTAADRFRFAVGAAVGNPAFNSNNQPDLFPSFEAGPGAFVQCGDRNHPAGNCAIRRCAPGTIFSFGAQVCTADDIGANTPVLAAVPGVGVPSVVNPAAAVGNAFPGVLPGVSPVGAAFPFKKK